MPLNTNSKLDDFNEWYKRESGDSSLTNLHYSSWIGWQIQYLLKVMHMPLSEIFKYSESSTDDYEIHCNPMKLISGD
jgi:hypothetical protein